MFEMAEFFVSALLDAEQLVNVFEGEFYPAMFACFFVAEPIP